MGKVRRSAMAPSAAAESAPTMAALPAQQPRLPLADHAATGGHPRVPLSATQEADGNHRSAGDGPSQPWLRLLSKWRGSEWNCLATSRGETLATYTLLAILISWLGVFIVGLTEFVHVR